MPASFNSCASFVLRNGTYVESTVLSNYFFPMAPSIGFPYGGYGKLSARCPASGSKEGAYDAASAKDF